MKESDADGVASPEVAVPGSGRFRCVGESSEEEEVFVVVVEEVRAE